MSIAIALEAEPNFPRQDLSDNNAMLLELMLTNADIVTAGHTNAEKISWVFRAGHPAMRYAANRIITGSDRVVAFDHGISSYETIAALLDTVPDYCDMFTINANAVALTSGFPDLKLDNYVENAYRDFLNDMPRTAEVVLTSSRRFHPSAATYAVAGAAVARQFELDGIE